MWRTIKGVGFIIGAVCLALPYAALYVANKATGGILKGGLNFLSELLFYPAKTFSRLFEAREEKLYRAIREGDLDRVKKLVSANVEADGARALHTAVKSDYREAEIIGYLLKSGIEPDCRDEFNNTALHTAIINPAGWKKADVCKALLDGGAKANALNKDGLTALHLAALYSDKEVITTLLTAGADLLALTPHGETAQNLALRTQQNDNAQILTAAHKTHKPPTR